MKSNRSWLSALIFALAGPSIAAGAGEIRLPAVIGDHMVLQSGGASPVWGWAEPGEEITVRFADQKVAAKAGTDGRFQAEIPCGKPGISGELTIEGSSSGRRVLQDVITGHVWICSGQSNMEWPLQASIGAEQAMASADLPNLRLFTVLKAVADHPLADCKGSWARSTPEGVKGFSAVGFFFGRELLQETGAPIGLINTSWGGTPAESWASRKALEAEPSLKPLLERWDKTIVEKPTEKGSPHRPANLYNAMIAPLLPVGIAGAIWYQGESNAGRAEEYRTLFPDMIKNWRDAWGKKDLPFYFVQLANFMAEKPEPGDSEWAELRDAQLFTLRTLPHTGMAVINDIGEAKDIHPRNKLDVGKRLARWALKQVHQKSLEESGPLYRSQKIEGGKIVLSFDHTGGGLVARGGSLKGFAIAGADHKYVWADARIEGETVVVSSPAVKEPAAVRYGWADNIPCTLYNGADLPASPFRTDDAPYITAGRH